MKEYKSNELAVYEDDEIPQDEEFRPQKRIVIGKQLLIIIQLVISGIALLFMVVIKLIGGDFCSSIINWYETNYYDSIYTSEDGKNDLSIFGVTQNENKSESKTENGQSNSKAESSPHKSEAS